MKQSRERRRKNIRLKKARLRKSIVSYEKSLYFFNRISSDLAKAMRAGVPRLFTQNPLFAKLRKKHGEISGGTYIQQAITYNDKADGWF